MIPTRALADVAPRILAGDIIAFAGDAWVSHAIAHVTHSPITHVGIITLAVPGYTLLMESTTLDKGKTGVHTQQLDSRLHGCNDRAVFWLGLSDEARAKFNGPRFRDFVWDQDGKQYDREGIAAFLVRSLTGHDLHDLIGWKRPDQVDHLFCSTLTSAAHQAAGILRANIIPQHVAPANQVAYQLYGDAAQLSGAPLDLPSFNTVEP